MTSTLTIASKNYGSWSLRGWLLCKMAGIEFTEQMVSSDDPSTRAELLLLSPSFLVPCLTNDGIKIWDTLAIGEYLHEIRPQAGLLPADPAARARCRSISGEMHSGFSNLRSALPMNLKAHYPRFRVWAGVQSDIDRIVAIWRDCLAKYGGPFLFGALALPGRRHVRAGLHPVPDLRRGARFRLHGLLPRHHGAACHAGMAGRREDRTRRARGTRCRILTCL
jgi:glutathione S-transferase